MEDEEARWPRTEKRADFRSELDRSTDSDIGRGAGVESEIEEDLMGG